MNTEQKKILNKSTQNENDETKRCNKEQKEILLEFLQLHPELNSGKFSASFTKKISRDLWTDVSKLLNSVPCGAIKNADQWKRCWSDMKRNTKSKASRIKKHKKVTGGGSETKEELNDTQIRIAEILGDTAIEGHKAVPESDVNFLFEEEEHDSSEYDLHVETNSSEDDATVNDTQGIHDVNDVEMVSTTPSALPSTSSVSLAVPRTFARPSTVTTVTPTLPRSSASHEALVTSSVALPLTGCILPLTGSLTTHTTIARPSSTATSTTGSSVLPLPTAIDVDEFERNKRNANVTPRGPRDKTPKLFSTKRLDNTVEASKKLSAIGETKIEMKSSYYAKKLSIMERQVIAKEEKVAVLKDVSNNLQIIANAVLLRGLDP